MLSSPACRCCSTSASPSAATGDKDGDIVDEEEEEEEEENSKAPMNPSKIPSEVSTSIIVESFSCNKQFAILANASNISASRRSSASGNVSVKR